MCASCSFASRGVCFIDGLPLEVGGLRNSSPKRFETAWDLVNQTLRVPARQPVRNDKRIPDVYTQQPIPICPTWNAAKPNNLRSNLDPAMCKTLFSFVFFYPTESIISSFALNSQLQPHRGAVDWVYVTR